MNIRNGKGGLNLLTELKVCYSFVFEDFFAVLDFVQAVEGYSLDFTSLLTAMFSRVNFQYSWLEMEY